MRAHRWSLLLAALVSLPSLFGGFVIDDWVHHAILRGVFPLTTWWDLFNFAPGDAEKLAPFITSGALPWFTLPALKIHFLRPLASALIAFDFWAFGAHAWAAHLHSVLWYLGLVAVANALYRRLVPKWALLAGLLFCIDDAHVLPVGWLANRNSLMAVLFVWLGLLAHLKWREDGWRAGRWLSVLAFLAGLSAGETAVSALAYVAAYELAGRSEAPGVRLRALTGAGFALVAFACLYVLGRCGASGSATYVDPLRETLAWLQVAPVRGLAMLGGWTFAISPDAWVILPRARPVLLLAGALALAVWPACWRAIAPDDPAQRRTLRWLCLGAGVALLPGLATFPANRLLLAPSLGLAALIAAVLRRAWQERARLRGKLVLAWCLAAFCLEPLSAWVATPLLLRSWGGAVADALLAPGAPDLTGRVILLTSSDLVPALFSSAILSEHGRPMPKTWHSISQAPHAHRLTRTGARRLELEVLGGHLLETVFEQNVRSDAHPFAVGDVVWLEGLSVTVLELEAGCPRRLALDFSRPLEDFEFVRWAGLELLRVTLPPPGEQLELAQTPTVFEALVTP